MHSDQCLLWCWHSKVRFCGPLYLAMDTHWHCLADSIPVNIAMTGRTVRPINSVGWRHLTCKRTCGVTSSNRVSVHLFLLRLLCPPQEGRKDGRAKSLKKTLKLISWNFASSLELLCRWSEHIFFYFILFILFIFLFYLCVCVCVFSWIFNKLCPFLDLHSTGKSFAKNISRTPRARFMKVCR